MTKHGSYESRIDMTEMNGTKYYAKYWSSAVGSASDYYRIMLGTFYGNSSDALLVHTSQPFSTRNADHDASFTSNCAETYEGAWWYKSCYDSNLNGIHNRVDSHGITWWDLRKPKVRLYMQFPEMKFRRKK